MYGVFKIIVLFHNLRHLRSAREHSNTIFSRSTTVWLSEGKVPKKKSGETPCSTKVIRTEDIYIRSMVNVYSIKNWSGTVVDKSYKYWARLTGMSPFWKSRKRRFLGFCYLEAFSSHCTVGQGWPKTIFSTFFNVFFVGFNQKYIVPRPQNIFYFFCMSIFRHFMYIST